MEKKKKKKKNRAQVGRWMAPEARGAVPAGCFDARDSKTPPAPCIDARRRRLRTQRAFLEPA